GSNPHGISATTRLKMPEVTIAPTHRRLNDEVHLRQRHRRPYRNPPPDQRLNLLQLNPQHRNFPNTRHPRTHPPYPPPPPPGVDAPPMWKSFTDLWRPFSRRPG